VAARVENFLDPVPGGIYESCAFPPKEKSLPT
jgi:hypothetical protein